MSQKARKVEREKKSMAADVDKVEFFFEVPPPMFPWTPFNSRTAA